MDEWMGLGNIYNLIQIYRPQATLFFEQHLLVNIDQQ